MRMVKFCVLILILAFIMISYISYDSVAEDEEEKSGLTYENFAVDFFAKYCTRCHASPQKNGAPFSLEKYEYIPSRKSRIRARVFELETMPPSDPRPTDEEREKLKTWIDEGAVEK